VVSPVSRMTTAEDREYLDSLTASRKKRLKGKVNLKRSLLISFVVAVTVLSLLELDSLVASRKMRLKGNADLKQPSMKYRYVIEGSYRVRSGMHTITIKHRVILHTKTHFNNHTSQGRQIDTSQNTFAPCTIESSQLALVASRLS
jgi:hypothetical protein